MTKPSGEAVLTERKDGVLVITLNRPDRRNAVNLPVAQGIADALDELDADRALQVGVLTGAGGTFCAGMDLVAFLGGERPRTPGRGFAGIVERPSAKPLIAAVEGHAVAGGFEIALACDLIVASGTAIFGLPEVKRGLIAGGGGLLRLSDRVSYSTAMEWALTGEFVDAATAHAAGLLNRLSVPGEALEDALGLAQQIASNAPLAIEATKRVISAAAHLPLEEGFAAQRNVVERVRASADAKEGAAAFRERRAPRWTAS